jgi:hypothetical protein
MLLIRRGKRFWKSGESANCFAENAIIARRKRMTNTESLGIGESLNGERFYQSMDAKRLMLAVADVMNAVRRDMKQKFAVES